MSYNITNIVTKAAAACTTLGYTISKTYVSDIATADLGWNEDINRELGQDSTKVLIVIAGNYKVKTQRDNIRVYQLNIACYTRNDEVDAYTNAASGANCEAKMDAFFDAFLTRGTTDNLEFDRNYEIFTERETNGWTKGFCTINITVTNCP